MQYHVIRQKGKIALIGAKTPYLLSATFHTKAETIEELLDFGVPASIYKYLDNEWILEDYDERGFLSRKYWFDLKGGSTVYHRADGPAIIHYHKNGNVAKKEWYWKGKRKREGDLPHTEVYDPEGNLISGKNN